MQARYSLFTQQIRRATSWLMLTMLTFTSPVQTALAGTLVHHDLPIPPAVQAILDQQAQESKPSPSVSVHKGSRKITIVKPTLGFSSAPSDLELSTARIFAEPLIPLEIQPVEGENTALAKALTDFSHKESREDISDLTSFISKFPDSRWLAALELNMGLSRFETGYLKDALKFFNSSWELSKTQKGQPQKLMADRAVAELLQLNARLGRMDELKKLFTAIEGRGMQGSNEQKVTAAREGLMKMTYDPANAFLCGPSAVNSLLYRGKQLSQSPFVKATKSTIRGTNLQQCKELADKVGLHLQAAKRTAGAEFIIPAVMHWNTDHFCAITSLNKGRYQLQDSTFDINSNAWVSAQALEAGSDGYFLVPAGSLPTGWQPVSEDEAKNVWGKGSSGGRNPEQGPCCPATTPGAICPNLPPCKGMPQPYAQTLNATLNMVDTPMSYSPPVGPVMDTTLVYKYLEINQPANFTFANFGPDWAYNWISYLTVDSSQNATVMVRGGGAERFPYTLPDNVSNPYPPNVSSQAILTIADDGVYKRLLPSGEVEVFNQPDGTGRIFMTQVIDRHGNSTVIQYDANFRLTSVTDTLSQVTSFTYVSNTIGNVGYYKISRITDPFGRFVSFAYESTTSVMTSITDVVSNLSTFTTDNGTSFISALTTPYGTTSFYQYVPPQDILQPPAVGLRFTFPDGSIAVLENWASETKSSFYWDREATTLYPNDPDNRVYSHCTTTKFLFDPATGLTSPVISFIKPPLESEIDYLTEGQSGNNVGTSDNPIQISRQMDDGSTQNYFYAYNKFGKVTKSTDPVGRIFSYLYAANGIDLLEIRQTRSGNNDLIGKWEFNNDKHLPNLYIDGSGQLTQYAYNSFGELTQVTDANSNVWTRAYDSNGYLTQTDGPLSGNKDVSSFTYDSYGRLLTSTDSEGYTLTFSYDALNRPVLTTYPDGTTEQTVWNKLDAILRKDRIGRWTQDSYNSMGQIASEIDPLGRKTKYAWCNCGSLATLTDPAGNITTWHHDLEGRQIEKVYQDSTTVDYVYENNTSRLKSKTDALNQITNYSYNLDNTLAQKSYTNAVNPTSTVNYTYDANYNRLSTIQNGWGTYTYSYNAYVTDPYAAPTTGGGRLSTVTNNVIPNSAVSYSYDALGRITSRSIDGANNSITWSYDAMNRITSEGNALGTFTYTYVDDQSGSSKGTTRLSAIAYPNSQVTNFSYYDNLGDQRLQQISNLKSDGTALSQFSYGYDPAGQITQWQQQQAGNNQNGHYAYDLAGQLITAQSGNTNLPPAYCSQNYYAYDSAANRTASQQSTSKTVRLGGSITAGDVLTLIVTDSGLSSPENVSYTVQPGDTLTSAAAQLAAAITLNTNLQTLGVNATSNGSNLFVKSVSPNITTYSSSLSGGATETIAVGINTNTLELVSIGGTKTTGDVLTITAHDPALSGGSSSASYTVLVGDSLSTIASGLASAVNANSNLSTLGVTATASAQVIRVASTSANTTTYTQSENTGATETIVFGISPNAPAHVMIAGSKTTGDVLTVTVYDPGLSGGSQAVSYTILSGDTLASMTAGLSAAINGNSNLQTLGVSSTSANQIITINSVSAKSTSYRGTANGGATETITVGINTNGAQTAALSGTVTVGDTVSVIVNDAALPGGSKTKTYTAASGNTLSSISSGLASAINADTDLSAAGITATAVGAVLNITSQSVNTTTYSTSTSGGATETISLAKSTSVTQFGYNNVNELTSTSGGGATRFEGYTNKAIKSATVNANPVPLDSSLHFNGNATLSSGKNTATVAGTDGNNNTTSNNYAVSVKGGANSSLTYDLNGNLTNDGTNTYSWDAENRLVKITYPGSGNFSEIAYDPNDFDVKITESFNSAIASIFQYTWMKTIRSEQRDGGGSVLKRFFARGESNASSPIFYTLDQLGSIRECTDMSGSLLSRYDYSAYGQKIVQIETYPSHFTFNRFFQHSRSSVYIPIDGIYSGSLGKFLNRDTNTDFALPTSANLYTPVGIIVTPGSPIKYFP